MPQRKLSAEEEVLVETIVRRKLRFMSISEEHAAVARDSCRSDLFEQAYDEASRALAPKTGKEIMYPARGTDMEAYYQKFESALTARARTPFEHMLIAKIAMGLNAVLVSCEYAYLSEQAQWEVDIRFTRARANIQDRVDTERPSQYTTQRLPVLLPIGQGAQLIRLQPIQVNEFLSNFSTLHHKVLWDVDSRECYKIIDVHYSQTTPAIESYEVQLQECPSAVRYLFDDVKQMLLRSSIVVVISVTYNEMDSRWIHK